MQPRIRVLLLFCVQQNGPAKNFSFYGTPQKQNEGMAVRLLAGADISP